MSNNNGYAEARRLILGLGDLFIANVFVGNLKGSVNFQATRNYAYQRPGNNVADVKGEIVSEEVILTAEICDFKLGQLRRALGINQAVDTVTAKNLRKREVLQLTGTTAKTLAETALSAGVVVLSKLDRSTVYVRSLDWTMSVANNHIARVAAGGIVTLDYVIAEYDFSDVGANSLAFGSENSAPNTFEVKFTHDDSTGKLIQVTLFKAMVNNDLAMAFNERESGDFTVHNISFKALIDLTKPEGQNLFEIIQEDA